MSLAISPTGIKILDRSGIVAQVNGQLVTEWPLFMIDKAHCFDQHTVDVSLKNLRYTP